MSRPNRRMAKRQAIAMAGYELACRVDKKVGSRGYTKPGSQKRW